MIRPFIFLLVLLSVSSLHAEDTWKAGAASVVITRFEAKIQATLARIWGEDTPAETTIAGP